MRIDLGLCRDPFTVHYLADLLHRLPPKHVFPAIFTASAGPPQRIAVLNSQLKTLRRCRTCNHSLDIGIKSENS